jgi:hypothetical protein
MIERFASSGLDSRYCGSKNKDRSTAVDTEELEAASVSIRTDCEMTFSIFRIYLELQRFSTSNLPAVGWTGFLT